MIVSNEIIRIIFRTYKDTNFSGIGKTFAHLAGCGVVEIVTPITCHFDLTGCILALYPKTAVSRCDNSDHTAYRYNRQSMGANPSDWRISFVREK